MPARFWIMWSIVGIGKLCFSSWTLRMHMIDWTENSYRKLLERKELGERQRLWDRGCLSSIHQSLWVFWPFPFEPNSMWLRLIKGNTVLKRMGRMPILFPLRLLFHHFSTSWYAFGSRIGVLFVFAFLEDVMLGELFRLKLSLTFSIFLIVITSWFPGLLCVH